jgi:hypothetical protein
MIASQHTRLSMSTRDDSPHIRDCATCPRLLLLITTRKFWHTDASAMQDTARRAASTRSGLPC